jgi:hypothetical protein
VPGKQITAGSLQQAFRPYLFELLFWPIEKKDQCSILLKTPETMSYNTTIVPAQKAKEMLINAIALLLEQQDYLENLSIEKFRTNEILLHQAKMSGENAKLSILIAKKLIEQIADF